mgnify:CR=1 FL=1
MKNILIYLLFLLLPSALYAHTDHYKNIQLIEMEIFKDGKKIGFSKFEFIKKNQEFEVKNTTEFQVKILGVTIFSIASTGVEKYKNDKLISFKSETMQNDKKKFVNLIYDKNQNKFTIEGSSFKGKASVDNVVGNWWNHKILQADSQISPLSGSIKKQTIEFVGKEVIKLYGTDIKTEKFKLKSPEKDIDEDKKLDFDIWYDKETALIVKIAYQRLGNWEYRLKIVK